MIQPTSTVLCAGIVVADHVCAPIPKIPSAGSLVLSEQMMLTLGGCAGNVAVDLARQGIAAAVVGRVGDDSFGAVVRQMLEAANVNTESLLSTAGRPTSQTMIINVQGQDRRYIHLVGANGDFTASDVPIERVKSARILYVGGYLLMPQLWQEDLMVVFGQARAAGVTTVLDVAGPAGVDFLARLEKLLPLCDVFLPNSDEAALILGEQDPVRQAMAFCQLGVKTTVITCGDDGTVLVSPNVKLRAGVFPMKVVDGSGSGDAFDAGFIAGLLKGEDEADCLRRASALGASCVRAIGTTTSVFSGAECEAFLRQNQLKIEKLS
jgi:sugar/nucleoside kinase (ribokinase family)